MDTNTQLRVYLSNVIADSTSALNLVPVSPDLISTPQALDTALSAAPAGSVLTLSNALVYPTALTLKKSLTLCSETYVGAVGRMSRDEAAPQFLQGITTTVDNYQFLGLDIRGTNTLVVMDGQGGVLDRCRLLGDPVKGAHRGIEWRGTNGRISRCFIDDIFQPAQDTQAIAAFDCGPGLLIEDCWLSAAAESVMFGGADPSSAARIPTAITLANCTLTKNPAWIGTQQVKCSLEFKNAKSVQVLGCHFEYAGTSQGQGAYLIDATVRNQNGAAPFSTIENVTIANCTGAKAGGILNILGYDNNHPSGTLTGLSMINCGFSGIDGTLGSGRLFLFDKAARNVIFRNITVMGTNLQALGYFTGPAPQGLSISGMTLPTSKYGWKIDGSVGGGSGHAALLKYMPDATLDATVV